MHILQVVHQFPPERIGGTEIYTLNLSHALADRDHQVTVLHGLHDAYNRPPVSETLRAPNLHVLRFQQAEADRARLFLRSFDNPAVEAAFAGVVRELRPDVIHFQHLKGLSARLVEIARRAGVRTVWHLHDYWAFCGNAQLLRPHGACCRGPRLWLNCADCAIAVGRGGDPRLDSPHRGSRSPHLVTGAIESKWADITPAHVVAPGLALLFAHRDRLLRTALAEADILIAPSAFVRARFLQQGISPHRLMHIDHGIELPAAPLAARPAGDGRLRAVYLGGLARPKGVHVLIEAFNGLDPDRAGLTIYGDESTFPEYVRALKAAVRHPGIHFAGPLARERLWEMLAEADVLVVPSLWFETSSLVAHEAFAAGVPVIAAALGALTERVRDGVDGLLVPPGDVLRLREALARLIESPELLARLKAGIRPVKSLAEHVVEIEAVYRGLT